LELGNTGRLQETRMQAEKKFDDIIIRTIQYTSVTQTDRQTPGDD